MQWWERLDGPVLGRYRLDRLLGEGGMARVFLATDVRTKRQVAFKTPKLESFPPDSVRELLARFNREFDSQASDPVQGVIPIYESGEFTAADGVVRPFLAMQYLSGGSLGDALGGTIGRRERTQTLAEVLDWLVSIARTVDRLHARRYLHRDIKPDNILFNTDGDPFLADLGIVGTLDPALGGTMVGATSMGVLGSPGSPGYQSPESIQADAALRNVSSSDQFSLAVTVYEALSGRLPMNAGTNQEWYGALMHWAPVPLSTPCPDLPAAAVAAVQEAMSAQANTRFASCSEFAKALADAVAARPAAGAVPLPAAPASVPAAATARGLVRPTSAAAPPAAASSRKHWLIGAIAAGVLAAVFAWATLGDRGNGTDVAVADGTAAGDGNAPASTAGATVSDEKTDAAKADGAATDPEAETSFRTVPFDFDRSDLRPDAVVALDDVVEALKRGPQQRVKVVGHADPTEGSAAYAIGISDRRARSVVDYLASQGIDESRIQSLGSGASLPIAASANADGTRNGEGIARNRRTEVYLIAAASTDSAAAPATGPANCAADTDADGLGDCEDKCAASDLRDIVAANGCARPLRTDHRRFALLFGSGEATLAPAELAILDKAVRLARENPRRQLAIWGNADASEGPAQVTGGLAQARARAVFDYVTAHGISADVIFHAGEGTKAPQGGTGRPNDSGERPAFARNRVVELTVIEPGAPWPR